MSSKFGHLSKMSSSCTSPASTLARNESGFQGPHPPLLIMPNSKTLRNLLPWLMRKSRSSCPADLSPSTSWECRPTTMRSMQDLHQIAMTFKVRSWQKKKQQASKRKDSLQTWRWYLLNFVHDGCRLRDQRKAVVQLHTCFILVSKKQASYDFN